MNDICAKDVYAADSDDPQVGIQNMNGIYERSRCPYMQAAKDLFAKDGWVYVSGLKSLSSEPSSVQELGTLVFVVHLLLMHLFALLESGLFFLIQCEGLLQPPEGALFLLE